MRFLTAVSAPWVLTQRHCAAADSSSSDEDERYEASPATQLTDTTSESSESPATAAALLMFALKGKTKQF